MQHHVVEGSGGEVGCGGGSLVCRHPFINSELKWAAIRRAGGSGDVRFGLRNLGSALVEVGGAGV